MNLSIVIPAYNEEARLRAMLEVYVPYFVERYEDNVEIIIVVNGSRDHTAEIARAFVTHYPDRIKVIVEPQAIGKGAAILLGAQAAQGTWIGFVDADGATPPAAFDELYRIAGEADVVIASRWLPGARVQPRQPYSRRCASRIFNRLVRLLFKIRITDTQCGAKIIRGSALRTVLPRLGCTRWAFDVDLLFQLRRADCRIVEIPTTWHDVAGSKVQILRASCEMVLAITRLRLVYSPFRFVVTVYDYTVGTMIRKMARTG